MAKEVATTSALRENLQGQTKSLEKECALLKSNLKQFHQWDNAKLRSVQEEMDICKVIYSLHGSFSQVCTYNEITITDICMTVCMQEATLIEQLTEKVQEQQRFITQLQANKRC